MEIVDMTILNLTQHNASEEQVASGVIEPTPQHKEEIKKLLTFSEAPSLGEIETRAYALASIAAQYNHKGVDIAMIGGAPYLMAELESQLMDAGVMPAYSFSTRESVEKMVDGRVVKTSVFRHTGWVSVK